MTRLRPYADSVQMFVVCVLSLWSFAPTSPVSISQVVAGENEPPTFVAWPEKGLGLSVDLTGFKKDIDEVKPDGRRYLTASHPRTKLNVSVTLEKVPTKASVKGCVEQLQLIQKSPFATRGQDVTLNVKNAVPTLEYTLRKIQGVQLDQKNVYACIAQDNVYADVQLSKAQYTAADAPLFQAILKSVRLQPRPSEIVPPPVPAPPKETVRLPAPAPPTSMELLNIGNALSLQSNYAQAIPAYEKAFELEKTHPQLDRTRWRTLIDNLGTAYGITGRLAEARATFEQGIQNDPTYPMFHYNLACTFADMNDLNRAMQSLKTAFRHRKNQNPEEDEMPDPRQNLSLQRFMKNDAFRNLVNDLVAAKS